MYLKIIQNKHYIQRWLLVVVLAAALLGVSYLEASHDHPLNGDVECQLCDHSSSLDVTVGSGANWAQVFFLAVVVAILTSAIKTRTFFCYLTRAPPSFSK